MSIGGRALALRGGRQRGEKGHAADRNGREVRFVLRFSNEFEFKYSLYLTTMPARTAPSSKRTDPKRKPLHKHPKRKAVSPPLSPLKAPSLSTEDADSATLVPEPQESLQGKRRLLELVKQVHRRLRYGSDTLLVALLLLRQVRFEVEEGRERLMAAVLVAMAGKVHEYRAPEFQSLSAWSAFSFRREELVAAEGEMLLYFGFRVPAVLGCSTLAETRGAVRKLEEELGGLGSALSFQ